MFDAHGTGEKMTLPDRLKNRPEFRGIPVPYMVFVRPDGVPDFKVTDLERWVECAEKKLCAICGEALDYWVWYLGGDPNTVPAKKLAYFDLGMHEECARFSASSCPYVKGEHSYANYIKPLGKGMLLIDMTPRKEVKQMFLARGRKSSMKFDMQLHCVHPGALQEVELVSTRKDK